MFNYEQEISLVFDNYFFARVGMNISEMSFVGTLE